MKHTTDIKGNLPERIKAYIKDPIRNGLTNGETQLALEHLDLTTRYGTQVWHYTRLAEWESDRADKASDELASAKQRIEELEALKTPEVVLPPSFDAENGPACAASYRKDVVKALRNAGIRIKE